MCLCLGGGSFGPSVFVHAHVFVCVCVCVCVRVILVLVCEVLAHLSPRLIGELILYQLLWRLSSVNIFKHLLL